MVSVAVLSLGCTGLVFVKPGTETNVAFCRGILLPGVKWISDGYFTLQRDSASTPTHCLHTRNDCFVVSRDNVCHIATVTATQRPSIRLTISSGVTRNSGASEQLSPPSHFPTLSPLPVPLSSYLPSLFLSLPSPSLLTPSRHPLPSPSFPSYSQPFLPFPSIPSPIMARKSGKCYSSPSGSGRTLPTLPTSGRIIK